MYKNIRNPFPKQYTRGCQQATHTFCRWPSWPHVKNDSVDKLQITATPPTVRNNSYLSYPFLLCITHTHLDFFIQTYISQHFILSHTRTQKQFIFYFRTLSTQTRDITFQSIINFLYSYRYIKSMFICWNYVVFSTEFYSFNEKRLIILDGQITSDPVTIFY